MDLKHLVLLHIMQIHQKNTVIIQHHWWAFIIPASHVSFWHYDHSACLYEPDWGDNLFFTTRSVNNQLQSNKWATKCTFQVATAISKEAKQSTLLWIMPEKWENRYIEASITEQLWWWPFISVVEETVKQWSFNTEYNGSVDTLMQGMPLILEASVRTTGNVVIQN